MFRPISQIVRPLAVAAGAALFLLAAVPTEFANRTGAVYVTTLPSGADVWVDGTYIGHSPVVIDALAAGRHAISLTKTGWGPQDLDIAVVAGGTAISSVQLQRGLARTARETGGFLAVKGVATRSLAIDGHAAKANGQGVYALASGTHVLVAETPGGKMTREVTVYPEMRTDVVLHDGGDVRSAVVAPALDHLPPEAIKIDGARLLIRYGGHEVIGRMGSATYRLDKRNVEFDSGPTLIGNKLYLPIELLAKLTANDAKVK